MRYTMILFLSQYYDQPEAEYKTEYGQFSGAQTNEAPVKYTISRLASIGGKLSRIVALVTDTARRTAYRRFLKTLGDESAYGNEVIVEGKQNVYTTIVNGIEVVRIEIPNDITVTDLLIKTIDNMLPLEQNDRLIIDATGGYRISILSLTLFTRFLRYLGIKEEFIEFCETHKKSN